MAGVIQKISRNSASSLRILLTSKAPPILRHADSPISLQTLLGTPVPIPDSTSSAAPVWCLLGGYKPNSSQSFNFFPSFPFGCCVYPVISTEFEKLEAADTKHVEFDDARTLWADSVKRKRKRKMNKHKYKKLRKRLRRKT